MARSSSLGGGVVAGVGWGIGDPDEKVSVPEPLHPVEAGEPDSKASGFAKWLSATCSWNFVKRQGRLFTEESCCRPGSVQPRQTSERRLQADLRHSPCSSRVTETNNTGR